MNQACWLLLFDKSNYPQCVERCRFESSRKANIVEEIASGPETDVEKATKSWRSNKCDLVLSRGCGCSGSGVFWQLVQHVFVPTCFLDFYVLLIDIPH